MTKFKLSIEENEKLDIYFATISKITPLSSEEECRLAKQILRGNRGALDKLVTANLRFVVSVAKQYVNQGISLYDLIGIGNLGLLKAATHFDGSKNFKFISYAVWWIRQVILQAMAEQSRFVRLPLNKAAYICKLRKAVDTLEQKYHRKPTLDEIQEKTGASKLDLVNMFTIDNVPMRIDQPITQKTDSYLVDLIASDDNVEIEYERLALRESLINTLQDLLQPREFEVVNLYYDLSDSGVTSTLEEIGDKLKLTRERIRQIKNEVTNRLKRNGKFRRLMRGEV